MFSVTNVQPQPHFGRRWRLPAGAAALALVFAPLAAACSGGGGTRDTVEISPAAAAQATDPTTGTTAATESTEGETTTTAKTTDTGADGTTSTPAASTPSTKAPTTTKPVTCEKEPGNEFAEGVAINIGKDEFIAQAETIIVNDTSTQENYRIPTDVLKDPAVLDIIGTLYSKTPDEKAAILKACGLEGFSRKTKPGPIILGFYISTDPKVKSHLLFFHSDPTEE